MVPEAGEMASSSAQHNVVFVATQHDTLYAFDADSNGSSCMPLWKASLIDAAHGGLAGETSVPYSSAGIPIGNGSGEITPEIGVTGTPVIDLATNTLYVVSKSFIAAGPSFYQRLHAIDLDTGAEKFAGPVVIAANYPGSGDGTATTTFVASQQNQRSALALANGTVYIVWASHEDRAPYYGWVIGYDATSLAQTNVLNVSPNVGYGGIWMGGGAPAVDSSNNLYVATGNATFDVTGATAPNNDYGDSFLKLNSNLEVMQYFTPSNETHDNLVDLDFGSGGATLIDLPASGTNPVHLVAGGGKDGYLYELWSSAQGNGNAAGNAVKFTLPTVANGRVYVGTRGDNKGGANSSTSSPGELDVYGLLPN
jgi:hypothetical protein